MTTSLHMGTEQNLPFFAGPRSSITHLFFCCFFFFVFFLSLRKPWKLKEIILISW